MPRKPRSKLTPQWLRLASGALVVAVIVLAMRGLATNYLPDIHDITPLIWAQAFFEGVQSGWWYPVWLPQIWYGFGLPVFQFYAPLYYWCVAALQGLGLNVLWSTKALLALSLAGGWWFTYIWTREWLSKPAAILSASLFIWAPYYLSLIYLRGAFPEFFALGLLPLLLWSLTRLLKKPGLLYLATTAAVLTILFIGHTLTSGLALGLALLYVLYLRWAEPGFQNSLWPLLGSLGLALALAAFQWLPALTLSRFINTDILISGDFAYFQNFLGLRELVNLWSNADWSWKTLGVVQIAVLAIAVVGYKDVLNRIWARRILAISVVTLALLFMTLPASDFIWSWLPIIDYLQFPSRLLGPAALLIALLAGVLLETFVHQPRHRIVTVCGVVLMTIIIYWPHAYVGPNRFEQEKNLTAQDLNVFDYLDKTIFSAHAQEQPNIFFDRGVFSFEYMPREMPIHEARVLAGTTLTEANERYLTGDSPRFSKVQTEGDNIQVVPISEGFVRYEYRVAAETDGRVRINQFEFPTWIIALDGQPVKTIVYQDQLGQFLDIPAGTHTLSITFKQLPITIAARAFSGIVLILTILSMLAFALYKRRKPSAKLTRYGKKTTHKKSR